MKERGEGEGGQTHNVEPMLVNALPFNSLIILVGPGA